MAAGLQAYLDELRAALRPALCLHNFPSEIVERHSKPVIEVAEPGSLLVLPPVTVARSLQEHAFIEQSVNSTRVSLKFKAADALEEYLLRTFLRFMMHRADQLEIVRRVPLPGYDLTLLLTHRHLERYSREGLLDFICQFVEDVHSEVSAMKLGLRSRARAVVQRYWQELDAVGPAAAGAAAPGGAG